jgi:hypothetical protein
MTIETKTATNVRALTEDEILAVGGGSLQDVLDFCEGVKEGAAGLIKGAGEVLGSLMPKK